MRTRLILIALAALCLLALAPGAASAYRFSVDTQSKYFNVYDMDKALDSTVRVTRGGVEIARDDFTANRSSVFLGPIVILPGDTIEVYQPQTATPPNTPVTAAFAIPDLSLAATPGSPVVSGAAPDGWTLYVASSPAYDAPGEMRITAAAGGIFSATFGTAAGPGNYYSVLAVSPNGDVLGTTSDHSSGGMSGGYDLRVPGDAQCIALGAASGNVPGKPRAAWIEVNGIDNSVVPTTRVVLRRGGVPLADKNSEDFDLPAGVRPQPGDVVEVYRPKEAPAPAYSFTIPQIGGVFDPGNDLVAVTAPAASSLHVLACRPVVCVPFSNRSVVDAVAGRTILDFGQAQADNRARDLLPDDTLSATWISADYRIYYNFDIAPGDLTSPIGKIRLAKSLRARKLGKKTLKVSMTSSEAGTAVSKLTIPGRTRKSKPVTLAKSRSSRVKPGKNRLALKFTKTGKKTLKTITKKRKSRKATLMVTLKDTAGNVTTVVKSTKIKP